MRVEVYWNTHKNLWSVRALAGPDKGRVITHLPEVYLEDCTFAVQPAGRERVRREKKKNVHAFVRGTLSGPHRRTAATVQCQVGITYNPYMDNHFRVIGTHAGYVYSSDAVRLGNRPGVRCGKHMPFPVCTAYNLAD